MTDKGELLEKFIPDSTAVIEKLLELLPNEGVREALFFAIGFNTVTFTKDEMDELWDWFNSVLEAYTQGLITHDECMDFLLYWEDANVIKTTFVRMIEGIEWGGRYNDPKNYN